MCSSTPLYSTVQYSSSLEVQVLQEGGEDSRLKTHLMNYIGVLLHSSREQYYA
jgi:hypothetical protein